jgi:RNA polymerase primary sigma factor
MLVIGGIGLMFRDFAFDAEWESHLHELPSDKDFLEEDERNVTRTEGNPLALYLRDMARYPLLKPEEERELAEEIQYCQRALISLFLEVPVHGRGMEGLKDRIRETLRAESSTTLNANLLEQVLPLLGSIDAQTGGDRQKTPVVDEIHHLEMRLRRASDRMVWSNLRLVFSIARKYFNTGLSLADLVQEGNMGLLRAVARFNPDRGVRFSTYATWWIRQAIRRGIEEKARTIRMPVHMLEALGRYRDLVNSMSEDVRELPPKQIMRKARLSERQWKVLQGHTDEPLSLDTPRKDETARVMDLIADGDTILPSDVAFWRQRSEKLKESLRKLSLKEEMIIEKRFGLNQDRPYTLDEISRQLGVSRERVRQIEQKALHKLRSVGKAEGFDELMAT